MFNSFIVASFRTHLGRDVFSRWGPYETLASGIAVLACYWLILLWMDRRRIYLKI